MKTTLISIFVMLAMYCNSQETKQEKNIKKQVEIATEENDSIEYDIVVTDIGYDAYLVSQPPMNFYSESYYKSWNQLYVMEYNNRYRSGPNQELYENEIDYDPRTEYGLEVEYKLYYYFRFFEKRHGLTLVQRGR